MRMSLHGFKPPTPPQVLNVFVPHFSSSLRKLSRGYLVFELLFLLIFLGRRDLGFLGFHCARQGGRHSLAPYLVPTWKGAVSVSVRTLPAESCVSAVLTQGVESLLCSPGPKQGLSCFPFCGLSTSSLDLPPRVSRDDQQDWRQIFSDAHPLKGYVVYTWLRVPLCFHSLPLFVKIGHLCGFLLGQKCSSWYCTIVCMRGLGGGLCGARKVPRPLSLSVVTGIQVGGSGRGQVNVQM